MGNIVEDNLWLKIPVSTRIGILKKIQAKNIYLASKKRNRSQRVYLLTTRTVDELKAIAKKPREKEIVANLQQLINTGVWKDRQIYKENRYETSLRELARQLNRDELYFYNVVHNCKAKWSYMLSFDKSMKKSILKYLDRVNFLREKLQDLYYSSEQARKIMYSYYNTPNQNQKDIALSRALFNTLDPLSTSFTVVQKWEKIYKEITDEKSV